MSSWLQAALSLKAFSLVPRKADDFEYRPVSTRSCGGSSTLLAASVVEQRSKAFARERTPRKDHEYYLKCMAGGALACGLTHAAVTPIDIAKCHQQVNPRSGGSLLRIVRTIYDAEGAFGLTKGWHSALIGYSMQGLLKYGLYEYFKDTYSALAGEKYAEKYKGIIWCLGSASAEVFADIALCPMEMTKVKIQTSPTGAFPTQLGPAVSAMQMSRIETRFPFGSILPLWGRQIPYTVAKFYFFERVVSFFYTDVFQRPKESFSRSQQLGVTFTSGYIAGILCAIVSHPADNLVSQLARQSNKGKSLRHIIREVGPKSLMTNGLGTRILMTGTLTGLQWYIYDTFKSAMNLPVSG